MTQLSIVVEEVTDSFRIFHTNFELTGLAGQQVSRNEPPPADEEWSPLAMEAAQITGVETVVLRPYGLGLHRATAFEWEPIEMHAERLLRWVGETFAGQSVTFASPAGDRPQECCEAAAS